MDTNSSTQSIVKNDIIQRVRGPQFPPSAEAEAERGRALFGYVLSETTQRGLADYFRVLNKLDNWHRLLKAMAWIRASGEWVQFRDHYSRVGLKSTQLCFMTSAKKPFPWHNEKNLVLLLLLGCTHGCLAAAGNSLHLSRLGDLGAVEMHERQSLCILWAQLFNERGMRGESDAALKKLRELINAYVPFAQSASIDSVARSLCALLATEKPETVLDYASNLGIGADALHTRWLGLVKGRAGPTARQLRGGMAKPAKPGTPVKVRHRREMDALLGLLMLKSGALVHTQTVPTRSGHLTYHNNGRARGSHCQSE